MAFALTSLTAAETAAYAADKPMLVSPNRLLPSHASRWSQDWTATDYTDSSAPPSRLCDDFTHLQSTHLTAAEFSWMVFDFGSPGITFDVVALLNITTTSSPTWVTITISDANNFAATTVLYSNGAAGILSRYVIPLSQRVTGARYVRVAIVGAGGVSAIRSCGELIFGQRCQFDWKPDVPYDDFALASPIVRRTTTITGITNTVALGPTGQRRIRATCPIDSSATQTNLRSWWTEAGGARPFLWIENPYTAPNRACLMHQREAAFSFPYTDALNREFVLDAEEQGPNYVSLET